MKPLLIIGGATGTGKSALAVEVAKKVGGEIVSADSMQIYRGLDIGTAKITREEMKGIPHHMIDIAEPTDLFTAADYKVKATTLVEEISARGNVPILCGGTGLYINAVLYNLSFSGEYDAELRNQLQEELKMKGKTAMHDKLFDLDPKAAARLHVNDEKRVLRAIEKALTGGRKEDDFVAPKYSYKFYVTELPREIMYRHIEARVDEMIAKGLVAEVQGLVSRGIGYDRQCMQAIAYKEWAMCDAGLSDEAIVELIKKNTRNYAKRQVTWFKQYRDALRLDMTEGTTEEIAEMVAKHYIGESDNG